MRRIRVDEFYALRDLFDAIQIVANLSFFYYFLFKYITYDFSLCMNSFT